MSQTHVPAALRRLVRERARECCEYCLIPEAATFLPHWIDHIVAEKHGGLTDAKNLAYCCAICNRFKGSDLSSVDPETNSIVLLFNPRTDQWTTHFRVLQGRIEPLTSTGRATARLLQFNTPERVDVRRALVAVGLLQD